MAAFALAIEPPARPLARLLYGPEVLNYCMLGGQEVRAGLERELTRLRNELGVTQQQLEMVRMDAWKAAYAEWRNPGLGGFRGWRRDEGQAAVKQFQQAK